MYVLRSVVSFLLESGLMGNLDRKVCFNVLCILRARDDACAFPAVYSEPPSIQARHTAKTTGSEYLQTFFCLSIPGVLFSFLPALLFPPSFPP